MPKTNHHTASKDFASELLHRNDIELKYHYGLPGYLKLLLGGTAKPTSIDVYSKEDHELVMHIEDPESLDALADD